MKLRSLGLCALAVWLCSCTATSVKKTWKASDFQRPLGKIAVVALAERALLRQGFENRFVAQLTKAGSPAVVTFDQLSLPDIQQDKRAAAERLRANGAETLLILRLVGTTSTYHQVQLGLDTPTSAAYDRLGWHDYYSAGFMGLSPTYDNYKENVDIETSLFDIKTEKRIWLGITRTVLKENMDRVEEMDPLVKKIIAAMRKDGVIP